MHCLPIQQEDDPEIHSTHFRYLTPTPDAPIELDMLSNGIIHYSSTGLSITRLIQSNSINERSGLRRVWWKYSVNFT